MTAPHMLHDLMTQKVLRAKKEFFDRNPSGRILNRFSSDLAHLDFSIINCAFICVRISVRTILILIVISSISNVLILTCILISYIFIKFGMYFKEPIARLKQLESVSRSPMYSDFSSTLSGILIIRCYRQAKMFIHNFMRKLNIYGKVNLSFLWSNRTLGICLDILACSFTLISLGILVFWTKVSSGWIGLGIMSLISF